MRSRLGVPRTLVSAALVPPLLWLMAGTVLAKGPESVTITGPGIDQPLELMKAVGGSGSCDPDCSDSPLVRLMEQTGLWYASGDLPIPLDEPAEELGSGHTLTWVRLGAPDETLAQRTIRQIIYLEAQNGPIVHTPDQQSLKGWGAGVVGWFRAPPGLPDTLVELGLPTDPERSTRTAWLATGALILMAGLAWTSRRLA